MRLVYEIASPSNIISQHSLARVKFGIVSVQRMCETIGIIHAGLQACLRTGIQTLRRPFLNQ
jgi:hypothetical protein